MGSNETEKTPFELGKEDGRATHLRVDGAEFRTDLMADPQYREGLRIGRSEAIDEQLAAEDSLDDLSADTLLALHDRVAKVMQTFGFVQQVDGDDFRLFLDCVMRPVAEAMRATVGDAYRLNRF